MIERILPEAAVSSEVFGDDPHARLLPEEEQYVARAVERRRREFTLARSCARRALGELGHPDFAVHSGEWREPKWPHGVVGSITHCRGYCAAAVAPTSVVCSLGIDAEIDDALPEGVLRQVTVERERDLLAGLPAGANWDRLLFSAKESVYKAWFPLTGRWLGFEDAFVRIDPPGEFHAELVEAPAPSSAGELTGFSGRFRFESGLVITAVTVFPD
ncbi:4'-phosphopantetheinyl transferase EntD (siderophore biosynthesis) [Actinopolyspora mzabensis]|uniref:4'-phosphopantetheinyl transferase EntD (Siderophore biosynthesis) n=1 Tax=Actinopolyspora mzabensis TaxID=995066 RepID=A0A1G8ZSU5_ACTMZ|nr:4'-phosphopantetheinyl transferase superfamily protein [Actinopolyspora mzabensis]SDK17435.1 4'-phosphopantetheinyl transferase EntD (siderophore biosynthesis) [Actinopolyspora mzabensis]